VLPSFSEEKEAKRLFPHSPEGAPPRHDANRQKFFGSFFQKRTAFFLLSPRTPRKIKSAFA
jgi:hypothetical protein